MQFLMKKLHILCDADVVASKWCSNVYLESNTTPKILSNAISLQAHV